MPYLLKYFQILPQSQLRCFVANYLNEEFLFFPFISYIFSFQNVSDQHSRILYVKYAYNFIKNNDIIFIKSVGDQKILTSP